MLRFILFLCCLFAGSVVWAQNQTGWVLVSGRVLQEGKNTPMASVTLIARPSRSGTTSLADGSFKLKARPGDTIYFSSVGFKNGSYLVTKSASQANLKIYLSEQSQELREVEITTRPSAEKINRALRNMKRAPEPNPTKAPPAPEPLFEEKVTTPVKTNAYNNPATFLYDKFSKEGKVRQKMEDILEAKEQARRDSIARKKEIDYDKLFLDRNKPFKQDYYYYRRR